MNWQNQYCQNGYIAKKQLHVPWHPRQNSSDIRTEIEKSIKFIWKHKDHE
jgi:hypothetical protein